MLAVGSFTSLITFQERFSYLKPIPFTPLRSVHFTHLSTAQHKWLSLSMPQIHAVISFRSTFAYPPTLKTLQTLQDLQPSTHKKQPVELHSIPQRFVPFRFFTTYAQNQRLPMVYFLSLRRVSPERINRLKAVRLE